MASTSTVAVGKGYEDDGLPPTSMDIDLNDADDINENNNDNDRDGIMIANDTLDNDLNSSNRNNGKQGHICCGVCCDTRRAVMIVNSIMIFIYTLALFGLEAIDIDSIQDMEQDDDDIQQEGITIQEELPMGLLLMIALVQIICYTIGIYGAVKYHSISIMISMTCYSFMLFLHMYNLNLVGIVIVLSFIYPHYYFLLEIKKGIMTFDNYYRNEIYSCCCI